MGLCLCVCVSVGLETAAAPEAYIAYLGNWLTLGRERKEYNWGEKRPLILLNLIEKKSKAKITKS